MNKNISLIGLVTGLAVLKKNCNLSDNAVNEIMVHNSSFETIVKHETNMSDMDYIKLVGLINDWQDNSSLEVFGFRLDK
jgi:hypothetical protein